MPRISDETLVEEWFDRDSHVMATRLGPDILRDLLDARQALLKIAGDYSMSHEEAQDLALKILDLPPNPLLREWVPSNEYPQPVGNHETMRSIMWLVDGQEITETSLKGGYMYYQHEDGRWSRPKHHNSTPFRMGD